MIDIVLKYKKITFNEEVEDVGVKVVFSMSDNNFNISFELNSIV